MAGVVVGLHVNPEGGVPKWPQDSIDVTAEGCLGDRQNDTRHHGGPNRAVCLMKQSVLQALQEEGHPIGPGTTGENILIGGIDEVVLAAETVLAIGPVRLQLTGDAPPCKTIRASFSEGAFTALSHKRNQERTRWYARVLTPGTVELGDVVHLINGDEPVGNQ